MSPSGPKYAGGASAGADWADVSNAIGVEDGNTAYNGNQGPGGGGHVPSQLVTSDHGFNLPSTAIIDGIKLEAVVYGDTGSSDLQIEIGNSTKTSTDTPDFGQFWPNPLSFLTWGSATDLWGVDDWTPDDINDSTFGASLSAFASHATGTIAIDAVRITVYWHTTPTDVPKRYIYKVFNSAGNYLGNLPKVKSQFGFAAEKNTTGSQITVECGISVDTASQEHDALLDEQGNVLLDQLGYPLLDETPIVPIFAVGSSDSDALIKNGNTVQVFEYGYYHPNGKCMFLGIMKNVAAGFGGDGSSDAVRVLIYGDGEDLNNFMIRGNPYTYTADVSQTSQNGRVSVLLINDKGTMWNLYGQTWEVGVGVTNLGAIDLLLDGIASVTINVYTSVARTTLLGSVTKSVSVAGPTVVKFAFANTIVTTPGNTLFFEVIPGSNQSIWLHYSNANPYADGVMQNSSYAGGGGGSWGPVTGSDLYFVTYSGTGSTTALFTDQDPTTGMLIPFMDDYNARGGIIEYTDDSIDPTGLELTYQFKSNTIYEGIQAVLTMSPSGFYYYVDLGTNILNFKETSTEPDLVLIKGVHINSLELIFSIENVVNQEYVTGGDIGGGVNLYKLYSDPDSILAYRHRLARHNDNKLVNDTTADAVGNSAIAALKDEQNQTTVAVLDRTMDITLLKPGLVVGFAGFGTFADNVTAQIVRVEYSPGRAVLTLGIMPQRLLPAVDQLLRGLTASQTLDNPSSPG